MNELRFYVYAVAVDGVIRYIGKGGSPRRSKIHLQRAFVLLRRIVCGQPVKAISLYENLVKAICERSVITDVRLHDRLTEEQAFELEIAEIASAPEGQLWNLDRGGRKSTDDMIATWARDPERAKRRKDDLRTAMKNPERIAVARSALAKIHTSPDIQAKKAATCRASWTPEKRAIASEKSKQVWTPERRAEHAAKIKAARSTAESRAKTSAAMKVRMSDQEARNKQSQVLRRVWADSEKSAPILAGQKAHRHA